ncbi:MAG: polysaccharide deacetylase family protein [Rhodobacteraceae bacterium]|nr:polysaccharide deacetylase family protein [Paracoccaceae bacterium]
MSIRHLIFRQGLIMLRATGLGKLLSPVTQGPGVIFTLHHVNADEPAAFSPNEHLAVTPDFLRQTVEQIRESGYEFVSLDEVVDRLKSGYGHRRFAALTFDDGYRDNLSVAYPILKELKVPFTIYVATGFVDREAELWWKALEQIIGANDRISINRKGHSFDVTCATVEEKLECYRRLIKWMTCELDEYEQRTAIRDLARDYDFDLRALVDREIMTWEELRTISDDPLVTIGAHTHGHYALGRLPAKDIKHELDVCYARLKKELGLKPRHFAYPYGYVQAVSDEAAGVLADFGFSSSVTTQAGHLQGLYTRNLQKLPRVSLNGCYQTREAVEQYLTGAPFALYRLSKWVRGGFGLRSLTSRLFPSTR